MSIRSNSQVKIDVNSSKLVEFYVLWQDKTWTVRRIAVPASYPNFNDWKIYAHELEMSPAYKNATMIIPVGLVS